ncbi:MAG: hypothetical protein CMI56_00895 [Parcubacteria group bacterium]|nr:hypothetical protein [Parcubacteria group bacterium]
MISATQGSEVQTGHQAMIHDAQLDFYSRRLATCSSDRTIKVFAVSDEGNQYLCDLQGHDSPVWGVQWAHPRFGNLIASCGYDGQVLVHREHAQNQWSVIYQYKHETSVNSAMWAPHEYGLILAAGSSDGNVSVHYYQPDNTWSVQTFFVTQLGVLSVSWAEATSVGAKTEDGKDVLRIVTGSCDNTAKIWKCEYGQSEWENEFALKQHTGWVRDVAWRPSITTKTNVLASCSQDGTVVIWTQEKAGEEWTSTLLNKFSSPVWRVSWSITGHILGVANGDNETSLWKYSLEKKWEEIAEMPGEEEESTASEIIAEKDTAGTSSAASMAADEGVVKNEESGETASVPPAPQVQQNDMQGGYTQQQEYAEQQLPSYGQYNQQYSHQQQGY